MTSKEFTEWLKKEAKEHQNLGRNSTLDERTRSYHYGRSAAFYDVLETFVTILIQEQKATGA